MTGTIATTKTGEASFVFTGCTNASGNCSSTGAVAKEIKVPGVALKGAPQETKDFILNTVTEFDIKCGTVDIKVKGSLLIPVTPESKLGTLFTFAAKGKAGKQEPEESANHLEAKFETKGKFEDASLAAEGLEVTFEEQVEFI